MGKEKSRPEGEGLCQKDPICLALKVGSCCRQTPSGPPTIRQTLANASTFFPSLSVQSSKRCQHLRLLGACPSLPGAQNNYANCPMGFIERDGTSTRHVRTHVAGQRRESDKTPVWQVQSHSWAPHWPAPYLNWLQNNPQDTIC